MQMIELQIVYQVLGWQKTHYHDPSFTWTPKMEQLLSFIVPGDSEALFFGVLNLLFTLMLLIHSTDFSVVVLLVQSGTGTVAGKI